jgi:hypothetical protein
MPKGVKGKYAGKNASAWKGGIAWIQSAHDWMYSRFGSPRFCEICKRTRAPKGKAKKGRSYFQWHSISGKYRRVAKDWKRVCYSCHAKIDNRHLNIKHNYKNYDKEKSKKHIS